MSSTNNALLSESKQALEAARQRKERAQENYQLAWAEDQAAYQLWQEGRIESSKHLGVVFRTRNASQEQSAADPAYEIALARYKAARNL